MQRDLQTSLAYPYTNSHARMRARTHGFFRCTIVKVLAAKTAARILVHMVTEITVENSGCRQDCVATIRGQHTVLEWDGKTGVGGPQSMRVAINRCEGREGK